MQMDEGKRRIVICGWSVFAMVVEASLAKLPGIEATRLDPRLPGTVDRIATLVPDVVMIERDSGQGDLALALLGQGVPLIELDIEQKRATALSGRQLPAVGIGDLEQMIEHVIPSVINPRGGKR
jgi:hypothetical protein